MREYIKQYPLQLLVFTYVVVSLLIGLPVDPLVAFLLTVEAAKSAQITNAITKPLTPNKAYQDGGRVRVKRAVCAQTAASEAGSTYRFFRVRSNDMIKDLKLDHDSLGTGCTMDFGVYRVNADDTITVRDADFFTSALAMAAAARDVNILREGGFLTVANMEKQLWEALGYTVDPQCEFEVVGTVAVAGAAGATGNMCVTGEVVGGH